MSARSDLDKLMAEATADTYAEFKLDDGATLQVGHRFVFNLRYTPMTGLSDLLGLDHDAAHRLIAANERGPEYLVELLKELRAARAAEPVEAPAPRRRPSREALAMAASYDPSCGPHGGYL